MPARADHVPVAPQTLTYNVTFSTSGQSVWGPGASAALPTKTVDLLSTSWNDSDTQSDIESFAGLDFGGEVGGGSSGQLGLEARFSDIGPGAVNVNYPVQIKMDVPAIDSFRTGQTISIGSNWTLQPGSSMSVSIPRGRVSIDGDMAVAANAFFNICFFGCSGRSDFFPPINLSYLNQPVASSDGETLQLAGQTVSDPNYVTTGRIDAAAGYFLGISGDFAPPDLHLTTVVGPDGKSLIASGSSSDFIDMEINLTQFIENLPGGQFLGVSLPPVLPGVEASANTFDANTYINVSQDQRVVFTPTVKVTMLFPQAVQYTVKTPGGAVVASGTAAAITYNVGNRLDIVVPPLAYGATLTAIPTFSITNSFTNNGTTVYDQNLVLDVLKLRIQTPEVEVIPEIVIIPGGCIDYLVGEECWDDVTTPALVAPSISVSEGPVYRETHPLYSTTDTGIITGNQPSWQLGGFGASVGTSFVLNPQYTPLASVTGPSTLNEGQQGAFTFTLSDADVDPTTLTYTYNWGDGSSPVTGSGPVGGKTFTDNHTYADNGAYTISLTVSDTHTILGTASKTVTVNNVAPVLTHNAVASINENGILTVSGAITDPGIRDSFTLTVNWGEGGNKVYVYPAGTTSYSISHLYLDDNPTNTAADSYTVSLTLKDKDNATDVKSRTVTVNNVVPTVFAGNNRTVDEGSPTGLGIDLFGKNLIANPNAEAGASAWTGSGGFTTKTYGPPGAGTGIPPVIVYRDANGGGPSASFVADESCFTNRVFDGTSQGLNDNSRSIYVPTGFVAYVYTHCDYVSLNATLTGPGTFNIYDQSSSLQIRQQTTFITTSSQGYYNQAIGRALDGTQTQFPTTTAYSFTGAYEPQTWSKSGTGSTSISPASGPTNSITFSYNGSGNFSGSWAFYNTATQTETLAFDWVYTGCHSWYQSNAAAYANSGGLFGQWVTLANTGGCSFTASGRATIQLVAGSSFGFYLSGDHYDSSMILSGSLTISNIVRTGGSYAITDPDLGTNVAQPNLSPASGALGSWLTSPASLNGNWSGPTSIPSSWAEFNETAVIYRLDIPTGGAQLYANVGVDNGVFIWMDGAYRFGAVQPGGPPATSTSYEYTNIDLGFVSAGTHYVQFLREDHGGAAAWAVSVTGIIVPLAANTAEQAVDTAGPASRGGSYFYGGNAGTSTGTQSFSLSGSESIVDTGQVTFQMSGWLGGIITEGDNAKLTATFQNGSGGTISSSVIGPVTSGDRGNTTKLIQRTGSGNVPIGTRSILLTLQMTRATGTPNDGAADNLSFVLLPAPGSQLSANFTDPGTQDTHTTTVNWGDAFSETPSVAGVPGSFTVDGSHKYKDNGSYTVTLTDRDDDTGQTSHSFTTTVRNVAPTVTGVEQVFLLSRSETKQVAAFTDPGAVDTHTASINWGDGTSASTGTVSEALSNVAGVLTTGTVAGTHTYNVTGPFPRTFTATVTVTDKDGGATSIPVDITVTDLEIPSVTLTATPTTIIENGSSSFTGRFGGIVFPPGATVFTPTYDYAWDFGDGSTTAPMPASPNTNITLSHTYLENGTYSATFKVRAFEGTRLATYATVSVTITVNNAAPAVTLNAVTGINENGTASLSGSFTDAGTLDTHTVTINWGDSSPATTINPSVGTRTFSATHQYLDDKASGTDTYPITVTVADDDNGSGSASVSVAVSNVAPASLSLSKSASSISENGSVTLNGPFTDPGTLDAHTVAIAWGDGATTTLNLSANVLSFSSSHQYLDDNALDSYTISVTVTDDDGGSASASTTLAVTNVAPASLSATVSPNTLDENDSTNVAGSFTDPGTLDPHTVTIGWGDGTGSTTINLPVGVFTFNAGHTYLDDNASDSYTISVTVADDDGGSASASPTITVHNVAPAVEAGPDQTVSEGDTVAVNASFGDDGTLDTFTTTVNWGDGNSQSVTPTVSAGAGTVSAAHTYSDSGTYTVTVCVKDDDQASPGTCDSLSVQVDNLPPTVNAGADKTANEGATVSVSATYIDPGTADTHTATIIWGDGASQPGSVNQGTDTVSGSHVYTDNGGYTVTVCVTDDEGASSCDTLQVAVHNVAPAVNAGPDQTATEGQTVNLSATYSDPGAADMHTATVAWGDGTAVETNGLNAAAHTVTGSHVYADDGTYAVTVCVKDDDNDETCDSLLVTIGNATPAITPSSGADTLEGTPVGVQLATFHDQGTADTHTATINWGDGSPVQNAVLAETPFGPPGLTAGADGTIYGSHLYVDDGNFTVTVTVQDDEGATASTTLPITVLNTPPVVTLNGPSSSNEGQTQAYTFSVADAGDDTWTLAPGYPSCGSVGTVVSGSLAITATGGSFTCLFLDGAHDTVVAVEAVDSDGEPSVVASQSVTVNNVAATVDAGTDQTIAEGSVISLAPSTFNDKGTADTHTATINWGDGTSTEAGAVSETPFGLPGSTSGANGTVSGSHVYADNGTYTVTVCVKDNDGAETCDTLAVTVTNVAPTVDAGTDQTIAEGSVISLTPSTFNDKGTADTHTATVNWGDGTATDIGVVTESPFGPPGSTAGANGTVAGSHVYADNGTYTVTVCVKDDEGGETCDTLLATVTNVAPTVDAGANQTIAEGSVISLAPTTFNDKGTADTHTATINWGDGAATDIGVVTESPFGPPGSTAGADGAVAGSHVYADNGTYTVTVCVMDDDGATTCDTLVATITNVAPTVNAGADQTIAEGSVISLAPSTFNDKGTADTHTATINWGDGTATEAGVVSETPFGPPGSTAGANGTVSGSHVYADNGTYTVTVCVKDDDGATTCDTLVATVTNVAPTVDAGADQTIAEGSVINLAPSTFNDKGTADTHTATIMWGDGTSTDVGVVTETPFGPPGSTAGANGTVSGSHVYADNGTYTVTVCVKDDDGAETCDTLVATVTNITPTVDAGANIASNEGDSVSLSPNSFNDKGTRDTHTATVNWGDGTPLQPGVVAESPFGPPGSTAGANGTVAGSHVYADSGAYTVTICVKDDDGAEGCDTLVATVYNVTPVANAGADQTVTVRQPFTLTGTWSDPGLSSDNPYHWAWTVTTPAVNSAGQAVASASGDAAYGTPVPFTANIAVPGTYTFTFTIVDKDGASNSDQVVVTIPNNHWVVFGANSVEFKEGSQVLSGDVGGPFLATGKTLTEKGVEVGVGVNSQIGQNSAVYGDSLRVRSKSSVYLAFFRELIDQGPGNVVNEVNVLPPGIVAPSLALPSGSVGTQDIWYNGNKGDCNNANTTCKSSGDVLAAGSYGDLRTRSDSKNNPVVIRLSGGTYYFESVNLGPFAELRADAPVTIYVAMQFDTDHHSTIAPSAGSGLSAKDIVLYVGGINGKKGTIGSHPKSMEIGIDNLVQANIYVPNGTLWFRQGTEATGAFVARDVEVGIKVKVTLDSAF